jgi:hypothetical protein
MSGLEENDLSGGVLPYFGDSARLTCPSSLYQSSRCILLFSESKCRSTSNIRSTVGEKVMGKRTVQLRITKIKSNNRIPLEIRTIINLLYSVNVRNQACAHTLARERA